MNDDWSDLAELTEALAMRRVNEDMPAPLREKLGAAVVEVADGVHTILRDDPMGGYWNKALGFRAPLSAATVDQIVENAAEHRVPAMAMLVQPAAQPDDFAEIMTTHGFVEGANFVKMFGPAQPRTDRATDGLRVERVGPERGEDFARTMAVGFGFEPTADAIAWFGAPAYFEGDWSTYAAFDGEDVVGVARLLVVPEAEAGALFGAATLPAARNRGAQSALLDARIAAARDLGCRWVSAETWAETPPDHLNPSQHNMLAAGLSEVHRRAQWVHRAP